MDDIAIELPVDATAVLPGDVNSEVSQEKFLTFNLGDKRAGVQIDHVKEIIEYGGVTRVPLCPATIHGVINLRGHVLPIVDLAARLGVKPGKLSKKTCFIVFEVFFDEESAEVGCLVDSVDEVIDIKNNDIESAPAFGSVIPVEFIDGMAKADNDFVILVNMRQALDVAELSNMVAEMSW